MVKQANQLQYNNVTYHFDTTVYKSRKTYSNGVLILLCPSTSDTEPSSLGGTEISETGDEVCWLPHANI